MAGAVPASRLEDPFELTGRVLMEKFRVDAVVARGGFGVLYRGQHLTLDRPIAIKVLRTPASMSNEMRNAVREAFEREARMLARLSHPSVVHVIEFGVEPGRDMPLLWMVLEWIAGQPLSELLRARNGERYTPVQVLDLMRPAMQALAYAHDQGVAHRDLKPANIMVTPSRHGAAVKLIDFGIAKAMDEQSDETSGDTQTQSVYATYSPRYAAPEQVGRARTGPWTDVHAIALILTEMLTGHHAYTSPPNDNTMLVAEVLNPQRPTPGRFGIDVGAWEPVLRRALALRPSERFNNAAELLAELESALGNATSRAPVDSVSGISGIRSGPQNASAMTGGVPFAGAPTRSRSALILGLGAIGIVAVASSIGFVLARRGDTRAAAPVAAQPATPAVASDHAVAPATPSNVPPAQTSPAAPAAPNVAAAIAVNPAPETTPSVEPGAQPSTGTTGAQPSAGTTAAQPSTGSPPVRPEQATARNEAPLSELQRGTSAAGSNGRGGVEGRRARGASPARHGTSAPHENTGTPTARPSTPVID